MIESEAESFLNDTTINMMETLHSIDKFRLAVNDHQLGVYPAFIIIAKFTFQYWPHKNIPNFPLPSCKNEAAFLRLQQKVLYLLFQKL